MPSRNLGGQAPSTLALIVEIVLFGWLGPGCATDAPYRWVHDVPAPKVTAEYRIGACDILGVRVWNQDAMSIERARVREDGKISLPFLKDVSVSGLTPNELSEKLQRELVSVIVSPVVTVSLVEPAPVSVSVLGEVATQGAFTLQRPAGVLQAIAAAGGLTPYAERDGIYVLRRLDADQPAPTRIRFRYRDLASGGTAAAGFLLQNGDVLLVE